MPAEVLTALKDNQVYQPESISGLSAEKFFDMMAKIFDDYESGDNIVQKLDSLIGENMHLEFCKATSIIEYVDENERLLLYVFCNRFVNDDDDMITEYNWEDYFESKSQDHLIFLVTQG